MEALFVRLQVELPHSPKQKPEIFTMVNETNFCKEVVTSVRENFGKHLPVFNTAIPATVRLAEISTADKSIFKHEPKGRAAAAYSALVKEVIKIGEKQRSKQADKCR